MTLHRRVQQWACYWVESGTTGFKLHSAPATTYQIIFPPDSGKTLPDNSPDSPGINEKDSYKVDWNQKLFAWQVLKKSSVLKTSRSTDNSTLDTETWGQISNSSFSSQWAAPRVSELIQSWCKVTQSNLFTFQPNYLSRHWGLKGFYVNEAPPTLKPC